MSELERECVSARIFLKLIGVNLSQIFSFSNVVADVELLSSNPFTLSNSVSLEIRRNWKLNEVGNITR